MSRQHHHRLLLASALAPLTVALVACGGGGEGNAGDVSTPAPSSASTSQSTSQPTSQPTSTSTAADDASPPPTDPGTPSGHPELVRAAGAALDAVQGSTLFSIDDQPNGWKVSVVTDEGTESHVLVSADGSMVTGGPTKEIDDGDDAVTDPQERQDLLDVPVDYLAAISAGDARADGGELSELDLDSDNGRDTWELTYGEDTPDQRNVAVDANRRCAPRRARRLTPAGLLGPAAAGRRLRRSRALS